ncbi:unnamed protein product [Parnassius apollo]|uniref:(apollo) hypothetical protein n=1 Tax=Parnassius apollo TaxID=110799 RepID=A0A8S3WVI6_PARAO|nr:unnamed protein product [Parnassius apollo]
MEVKRTSNVQDIKKQTLTSDKYKKVTRDKENKPPNISKKSITFDCESSDTDEEVVYADSDNSPYINEESNSLSSDITTKPKNKVTILSDIRLHSDNQRYFNFALPGVSSIHKIDPTHDNLYLSKNNNRNDSSDNDSNIDIF